MQTFYVLTRTPHQVAPGEPPQEPELLESYIDSKDGDMWTGAYLRHRIGDSQTVPEHVARIVMTDSGLKKHYACEPRLPSAAPTVVIEESHVGTVGDPLDE